MARSRDVFATCNGTSWSRWGMTRESAAMIHQHEVTGPIWIPQSMIGYHVQPISTRAARTTARCACSARVS